MKLSVALITYNHASFIAAAIEGALAQKTNFDFEIVIGEDDSSDGTREIVADYAKRFPGKIRPLFHSRKDVIFYRGKATGRFNFIQTLKSCTGEYVAMLDGDDFWTAPDKLQQQVDFLDAHREFVICAHDVVKLFPDATEEPWRNPVGSYDFIDLLTLKHFPPTCSVVYRNRLFPEFPDWFSRVMVGDFSLHLLNARFGRVAHLPCIMATYRQHAGGMASSATLPGQKASQKNILWNEGLIDLYQTVDEAFGRKYHAQVQRRIAELHHDNAWIYYNRQDVAQMRKAVFEAFKAAPFRSRLPRSYNRRLWVAAFCPWAYRAYTRIKGQRAAEAV
jgi:glycosyltransferase involved in cell wall biosynthesis